MNLLVVLTEVIKKVSQIYPLGSMNVCTNIHFNSANSYGYILKKQCKMFRLLFVSSELCLSSVSLNWEDAVLLPPFI